MSQKRFRNTLGKFFKKNKTAQMAYDMALGGMTKGLGMYTGGSGMYTGGSGDYAPDTNALFSQTKSSQSIIPQFDMAKNMDTIMVSKSEYVSEIYGPPLSGVNPAPFVLQSFSINPGLEKTFPWLSQLASCYDEYELKQLSFTFKSTTTESSNSSNGQVGTIILNTNYNAAAPVFTDKASMVQYGAPNTCRLTESAIHYVECDPDQNSGSRGEYVRSGPTVLGQDQKTYDHGKFQIAIANASTVYANVSLGELWVSYTVLLRKPKFFTALGLGITKDIFLSSGNETLNNPFGPVDAVTFVPTGLLSGQQNNLGCLIQNAFQNTIIKITFPAPYSGFLKLMYAVEGTVFVNGGFNPTFTGNVALVSDLYGGGIAGDTPSSHILATTSNNVIVIAHLRVTIATNGIDNTISIPLMINGAGSITQSYLDISEYNSGFSYLATGLGASQAPVFINQSGTLVVP